MICFVPSFCLPSPANHKLINLGSAAKSCRTADDSLQQRGRGCKLSFTSNSTSHPIFPLAFLQQFPAKVPNLSHKLYAAQRARVHLTDESEHYPYLRGSRLAMNSRSANQKARLVATRAMQHGFPRYSTQTNSAPQPNRNFNENNPRIASTNTGPHWSHGTEKHYGRYSYKSVLKHGAFDSVRSLWFLWYLFCTCLWCSKCSLNFVSQFNC